MLCRLFSLSVPLFLFWVVSTSLVQAQFISASPVETEEQIAIPESLSPEIVDSLMARLTDAQIRDLLRSELVRRAEIQEQERDTQGGEVEALNIRVSEMFAEVSERLPRWLGAISRLNERIPIVQERLESARHGVLAMLVAALGVMLAGVVAALLLSRFLKVPKAILAQPSVNVGYWNRLARTLALGFLEFIPVVAFVLVTRLAAELAGNTLGPLQGLVWIYHSGVSSGWTFLILARRVFSPEAPKIRISRLETREALSLCRLLKTVTFIAVAGWFIAGMFPNLGFGFPPALITVALTGTLVTAILAVTLWRHADQIAHRTQDLIVAKPNEISSLNVLAYAGPILAAFYLLVSWVYWLAHWLERGQHELAGPIGGLFALLALPVADRFGIELISSALRSDSDVADRMRHVLLGAWRALIAVVALYVIVRLWGLDLLLFAKGPGAPVWASTLFDISLTLLLGYLAWRLILVALYREEHASDGGEDGDPSAPPPSRLDTLTPLFRSILLVILTVVVVMILLSSIGVDIGPLLASAGIVGIAIGFGAQTLVRDVFSGIVFLIDDAFRIGEYIELDAGVRGSVESISFRSLILRHHRGPVITIPFGEMKLVTNHTRDWVIYKMSFRLEPETDPKAVKKIVKVVGQEFLEHPEHGPKFIEPLKSQGVLSIDDDSALIIRVKFKCYPKMQFVLRREIFHRLREVFAENGIKFARKKVEVVGNAGIENAAAEAALETPSP